MTALLFALMTACANDMPTLEEYRAFVDQATPAELAWFANDTDLDCDLPTLDDYLHHGAPLPRSP